jgi:hypothetical protein
MMPFIWCKGKNFRGKRKAQVRANYGFGGNLGGPGGVSQRAELAQQVRNAWPLTICFSFF